MLHQEETVGTPSDMNKEAYLARLSELDRANIEAVAQLFRATLFEMGRQGSMYAIGGAVAKQHPRKDIDLFISLTPGSNDPAWGKGSKSEDYPQFLLENFRILEKILTGMQKKHGQFRLTGVYEPQQDHEYDSPLIFRHEGKIEAGFFDRENKPVGTALDFIRDNRIGNPDPKRPSVLLTTVKPT